MNRNLRGYLVLLSAAFLAVYASAEAPNDYRTVSTAELRSAPQRYWARPILFIDTLNRLPGGAEIRFEGRKYSSFSTSILGNSYAVSELVPLMKKLDINKKYVFTGSVIQYRSGFLFFRKNRYYVIVSGVNPPVDTEALTRQTGEFVAGLSSSQINLARQPVEDILWTAYSSAVSYARNNSIELWQVFDPKSEHFPRAVDLARAAVKEVVEKQKTSADELLASYAFYYLAQENTQPVEPPKTEVKVQTSDEKKAAEPAREEPKAAPAEEKKAEATATLPVIEAVSMPASEAEKKVEIKEPVAAVVETPPPKTETVQAIPVPMSKPVVTHAVPRELTSAERKALAKAKKTALEAEKKEKAEEKAASRAPDVVVQKKAAIAAQTAPAPASTQSNVMAAGQAKTALPAAPPVKPMTESIKPTMVSPGQIKATILVAPTPKPTMLSTSTSPISAAPVKAPAPAAQPSAPAKAPATQPAGKP